MLFSKTTLPNGLRVVTVPMESHQSATVQIMVRAGSRDEFAKTQGLAHFLEHMVFKGTKNYPSASSISTSVDSIGGDINANTSKERTAFYIKAWDRYLNLSFDILSGFVKNPVLDEKEIEREKGVILEEIAMYNDLPNQKAPDVFEELLYRGKPLGRDILGVEETILSMKNADFTSFMRRFYTPSNMVLAIAGKFETNEAIEMVEEHFGGMGRRREEAILTNGSNKSNLSNFETNPSQHPEFSLVTRKTEQAHIVLGVRANKIGHPDRYKESVLNAILGGGMSSRIWTEVREKRGLAYYVRTFFDKYVDCGYFATRAGVKIGETEEAVKVILQEYQKMLLDASKDRVTEEELVKAKEYLKGGLALDLEDTHSVAEFIGNQEVFEGEIKSMEEIMKGIDGVSLEEIREVAKGFFQSAKLNLAIVGPFKDAKKFEKLLKL